MRKYKSRVIERERHRDRERENWRENSEVQGDNWAVRNKGMERGLQRLCVCVSHERVLFSDKYIVLISVCGDRSLCVLSPSETRYVCECVCVCMWPIVRWQSRRASCCYALSHRVHLIHQQTHTHTQPWEACAGIENTGERGMRGERETGRVKVRTLSLLPQNKKITFLPFIVHQRRFGDHFTPLLMFYKPQTLICYPGH